MDLGSIKRWVTTLNLLNLTDDLKVGTFEIVAFL